MLRIENHGIELKYIFQIIRLENDAVLINEI